MATQITADLPTLDFPREVDYPTQEDWAAFSAAAELNFGILGGGWSTQMQLWKTEANAMSTEFNTNATIAQGLANYQGDWTSKGYTLGQTVSVSGIYYICKLTHATGQNPTTGGSIYWNLAIGNWNLKVNTDMSGYTSKDTPVDADLIPLSDSAATFGIKKLTWANLKATIMSSFGVMINTLTSKTTPVNNDFFVIGDSASSNASKKLTWANLKATLDSTWIANDSRTMTALNATGTAPIYANRAWVNFNGTGTVAIRASGNVSSITDNGVGAYTANLATAMPDTNYSISRSAGLTTGGEGAVRGLIVNSSSFGIIVLSQSGGSLVDADQVFASVIR